MVIGLRPTTEEVSGAAQVFVATGNSEEEAVTKVAAIDTEATLFTAQVVPTFLPSGEVNRP
jgi:hypothetical protein